MNRSFTIALNLALILLLIVQVTIGAVLAKPRTERNIQIFPDMQNTPAHKTFGQSADLPHGMTQQPPVAGSIPRGLLPLPYTADPADAIKAGDELVNPLVKPNAADRARGQWVYTTYCQPCHGAGGAGDGIVAQRGYPPPPSLLGERAVAMRDGQIFHIITYGQGNMSAYAPQIARTDRWKVILHIRSLQGQQQ
jgi:mono/diheme cytochrome c family protein